jgi:hypothetical protein
MFRTIETLDHPAPSNLHVFEIGSAGWTAFGTGCLYLGRRVHERFRPPLDAAAGSRCTVARCQLSLPQQSNRLDGCRLVSQS